ncbi:Tyrosine recombinase XerC [termite gut metagenome]|uniref:Tyrosine recombinase XerC n=1 Tax=termite gut metagenome TaxID=433724 RepID=A0A5J4RPH6_9ZZZZ
MQYLKLRQMEATLFNVVYNRKKRLLSNGTALVQIEAYLCFKKKYFSTNIYLIPDQWDNKHRKVKNHPNAMKLNRQIADFVAKLQGVELDRRNVGKPFTLDILSEYLKGRFTNSFTEFVRNEIEADCTSAQTTRTGQLTTFRTLRQFKKDITFDELTFELLSDFERFLFNKGLHTNTVNKYFRHIRKFVNLAINKDLFDLNRYPFRKFKAKSETTNRAYLSPEELQAMENIVLQPEFAHLQKTLDMFLFSCYTGLRFSDISALSKDKIRTIDGNVWIDTTMIKTTEPIRIPLYLLFDGKPIEILNRYTQPDRNYIFDDLTNQYVNRYLKKLASMAGIKKTVTFHTARHTQATFLLYKGVNITTVQKLLGHKKLQTTQIYSKVMDKTIINELSVVKFG